MTDSAEYSLSVQDSYAYKELFKLADDKSKLFLFKNEAMSFFSSTGIPVALLEEIWQTVDKEQKEYITELEFYQALKLIACTQHGIAASDNILSTQAPLPQFTGKPNKAEIASITPNERDAYIGVFQNCNPVDGILTAEQAIELFNKSGLSLEHLRDIWELADTRKSGTLNKTEFIIAMHYITRLRSDPHLTLPATLPSQVYTEASGRFNTATHGLTSPMINNRPRASSNVSAMFTSPVVSHMMTSSTYSPSITGDSESASIAILPDEREKYTAYFNQLDVDGSGYIDSEEAVLFFSHSQLPNHELGIIWEIADSRHLGKLDLHDFSIAMHLISMRLRGENIDRYVNALSTQQQDQSIIQDQSLRYELENQLIEIKQQLNFEQQRYEDLQLQQERESSLIAALENDLVFVRSELAEAKINVEKAEEQLVYEQKRNKELLNVSLQSSSELPTPELTRAASVFSGASALSPKSDNFDPFAGFKKSEQSRSPQQSKSISKYGFDLAAFDLLSVSNDTQKSNVQDELASIFGAPSSSSSKTPAVQTSEFDSIFLN